MRRGAKVFEQKTNGVEIVAAHCCQAVATKYKLEGFLHEYRNGTTRSC